MCALRAPGVGLAGLDLEPHSNVLGACSAQSELVGQVTAQRAPDEEQRLTIFHRLDELPVSAREKRRSPGFQLIRFEAACEQHRVPPLVTKLALQLSRADRRHGAERAQAEEVEALELFGIERQLARGKRGEEFAGVGDAQQAAGSRTRRGKTCGERTRSQSEARFAADRLKQ